jgi:NAD(P)-dependent dehydrogenase (short-subunit alcohol dehydrogenase family)
MFKLTPLFDLTGRTALVTGGNSGIGLAMARALGLAGAKVALVARRVAELQAAAATLSIEGISAIPIAADLASDNAAKIIETSTQNHDLAVDITVNAAGINLRQPFKDVSAAAFDLHMALHLRAPFLLTQTFAPAMARRGWGRIVNVASMQSCRAFPDSVPYGAAKGGVLQLTRAIAEEWSRLGITCNAIAPGFFPTPLTAPVFDDPKRASLLAAQTAIGRNGTLDDLTERSFFLPPTLRPMSPGRLAVDGGFTAK